MNSTYQYCSRWGDELDEQVRKHYEENHNSGPVLCVSCLGEIIQGIPEALNSVFRAVNQAFQEAFEPLIPEESDE